MYYTLVAAAVVGVLSLRRNRAELLILATPLVVTTVTAFVTWGLVRLRHEAEIPILVLAGVEINTLLRRLRQRRGSALAHP